LKRLIDHSSDRQQLGVVLLHDAYIVPHPDSDLVDAFTATGEKTRECVSHYVRCHPRAALCFHVEAERSGEIVSVTIETMLILGVKHKRLPQSVPLQKAVKLSGEWNSALLAILEFHGGCLTHVHLPGAEVEPPRHRLDYLERTHAGMEPAVEDEPQIVSLTFFDEATNEIRSAKIPAGRVLGSGYLKIVARVLPNGAFFIAAPVKEAPDGHHIAIRSLRAALGEPLAIVSLNLFWCDASRHDGPHPGSKRFQHVPLGIFGRTGPPAARSAFLDSAHVTNEAIYRVFHDRTGFKFWAQSVLCGLSNSLGVIIGVERNKMPFPVFLHRQPPNIAALVESAVVAFSFPCHACYARTVTLCKSIRVRYGFMRGKFLGAYGARTRNLCRDRIEVYQGNVTPMLSHSA
jgi:hypothetical protein